MDSGTGQTMESTNAHQTVSLCMAEDLEACLTIVLGTNSGCFLLDSDLVDISAPVLSVDVSITMLMENWFTINGEEN